MEETNKGFRKRVDLFSRRVGDISIAVLVAMVLLVVVDVTLRRVFNSPLPYSFEVVQFMLVVVFFCSLPYATSIGRHVNVDILTSRFPLKVQVVIEIVTDLICAVLFCLVSWQSALKGISIWHTGRVSGILQLPYYPFLFIVAFGSAAAGFILFVKIATSIISWRGK